jgi:manganese/iron transport system permease protein
MDAILEPLSYGFFLRALAAVVLVGIACAIVGSYVVLKGLAFAGDAISHAALPGVVVAFILQAPVLVGAAVAAILTAVLIGVVSHRGRLRGDTAIGVLFAGMFALGVFLFSQIRGYVVDLFGLLFGNILAIGAFDLAGLGFLAVAVILVVGVFWKELLYATFDPLGAAAAGLPVRRLEYLLLVLIAITIVASIQAVGIILVVAMLVTPAATAQLLTHRFLRLVGVAIMVSVAASITGLYLSYWFDVPSGATIVLVQTGAFFAAMLLGPRSGAWRALRAGRSGG